MTSKSKDSKLGRPKQSDTRLSGTTLRIYRIMYKQAEPLGVNDIKRLASLSSSSVAHYHLKKLVNFGLAQESEAGYVVDRVIFENMIRIGSSLIPFQAALAVFFGVLFVSLLTVLRPDDVSSLYVIAVVSTSLSLLVFVFQTIQTLKNATFSK